MIKEIWGKIAYYWFVGMLIIVGLFCGELKVNASTTTAWNSKQFRAVLDQRGTTAFTSWKNLTGSFDSNALTYPVKAIQWKLQYPMKADNTYNFTIAYKPTPDSIAPTSIILWKNSSNNSEDDFSCSNWAYGTSGTLNTFYYSNCSFSPETDYSTSDLLFIGVAYRESYLTYLTVYVSDFEERLGTNAVITNQTNIINNSINNQTNAINNQTNAINGIDNDLKDSNIDNPNNSINEMTSLLPNNGVITQLIGLPITLYTKVLNSINGTCNQFNLGNLYNTDLIIPCIDVSTYLGSTIWSTIDLIISGAFVLIIAKKMIKAFENFTSMKEGDVIND